MIVDYTDKKGQQQVVVCDRMEIRPDGAIECYRLRTLEGILQLEPGDFSGRVIVF